MRGYLLRLCGIFIISAISEMIMPDCSVKKYSKILISLIVCITLLSPASMKGADMKIPSSFKIEDNAEEQIYNEYKKRVEKLIGEKCGCECSVRLNEKKEIEKVILKGKCSEEGKKFLNEELKVSENEIVFIENE